MVENPTSFKQKIILGVRFGFLYVCASIAVVIAFELLSYVHPVFSVPSKFVSSSFIYLLLIVVIIAPITEELIFRFIPIRLTLALTNSKGFLWIVILCVSIIFGYLHGSWHHIFIQGIAGICFSAAYLRGGLICSISAHMFVNGFAFTVFILSMLIQSF